MKVAFHSNQLSVRGTEIALYDYAHYNETMFGNECIVLAQDPEIWKYSHPQAIKKFKQRFPVYFYKNFNEVEDILDDNDIDVFYAIKAGMRDGKISKKRKTVIHSVFQHNDPHGDVYAYVSQWLGNKFNKPFVPHICYLPDHDSNFRYDLNIPSDAIVFGRHGGSDSFDIPFVKECIRKILNDRSDIYFLFLGTDKFISHDRAIFLDASSDMIYKTAFINTCDAMIHASRLGETFGLAIAEFSLRNKPVITSRVFNGGAEHLSTLGDNCYKYSNINDLYRIFNTFQVVDKDWNMYRKFSPENVMAKFNEVFLK